MSTESARDRFHVGQVVRLSPQGLERKTLRRRNGVEPQDRRGRVTGFKQGDPGILRVQVEPNVYPEKYHHSHWVAVAEAPEPRPAA